MNNRPFIPALGRDAFTPIYDLGIRLTMPERRFKSQLIESAHLAAGMRVLDLGCGTGTQENYGGLLPAMARDAGFVSVEETGRFGTIFGVLRSFRAARPSLVS